MTRTTKLETLVLNKQLEAIKNTCSAILLPKEEGGIDLEITLRILHDLQERVKEFKTNIALLNPGEIISRPNWSF